MRTAVSVMEEGGGRVRCEEKVGETLRAGRKGQGPLRHSGSGRNLLNVQSRTGKEVVVHCRDAAKKTRIETFQASAL